MIATLTAPYVRVRQASCNPRVVIVFNHPPWLLKVRQACNNPKALDLSPTSKEVDPVFNGSDGAEAEDFVTAVRRRAFAEGRQRDQAWMADYAATCLKGNAVRWFQALDREVREDWELLSRALLERWPPQR